MKCWTIETVKYLGHRIDEHESRRAAEAHVCQRLLCNADINNFKIIEGKELTLKAVDYVTRIEAI